MFEKVIKVSINEFDINPLYSISLPGYTWHFGLKNTGTDLQTLQHEDLILLLEKNMRGGISNVQGERYVKSDDNKKILYFDANISYGHSMSQLLPYDQYKLDRNINLEDTLNTPADSDFGYFVEADLSY